MSERYTRRGVLAAGAAVSVGLAGCLGEPPGPEPGSLSPGEQPLLGNQNASVTVTIFEDFGCPACRRFALNALPSVRSQHVNPGNARIFHMDYPIPVSEQWSYAVASAARAVFEEAGHDAFWSFSEEMFANQGDFSMSLIEQTGNEVANVGTAARNAAEQNTYRNAVDSDRDTGRNWGVQSTPTIFVGTESIQPNGQAVNQAIAQRL
jgi:protein-disulfide isomerase